MTRDTLTWTIQLLITGQEKTAATEKHLLAHTPTVENNWTNKGLPQRIQIESTHNPISQRPSKLTSMMELY